MKKERNSSEQLKRWISIIGILSGTSRKIKIKDSDDDRGILSQLVEKEILSYSKESGNSSYVRTIQRDLISLEELGYIIAERNNSEKKTGYYSFNKMVSEESSKLLKISLDQEMLQAFFLSRKMFGAFEGTTLKSSIDDFYENVVQAYNITNKEKCEISDKFIMTKFGPRRHFNEEQSLALDDILYACSEHLEITLFYNFPYIDADRTTIVKPHKLIQYKDSFYLLAADRKNRLKLYNLSRIIKAQVKEITFTPQSTDDFEKRLKQSFGMLVYGNLAEVKITFSESVHQFVAERQWHESAIVTKCYEGVVLTMSVLVNAELAGWIRGWGNAVIEVLPKELAKLI